MATGSGGDDGYEIRLEGRLDERWAGWFDGMTVTALDDGTTVLRGGVSDQAALHGLLARLRDLGLPLLSVHSVTVTASNQTGEALSPRALIVTVFGLYVREAGGWISVSRLIALMGRVGIDAQAVRSSVSRLKKRGVLQSERRGNVAGYAVSPYGEGVLAEGDRRIFRREEPAASDWVLAVFSVPESERDKRHALRSRLTSLGFGTVSSGVWIAAGHVADDVLEALARDGLDRFVDIFHADHLGYDDLASRVAQWWDLETIDARYQQFLTAYRPLLDRWTARRRPSQHRAEAFADYVQALTSWRQLPYLDPGLPAELLPAGWSGRAAAELFAALQSTLEGPAHEYVAEGVESDTP
jgi:phenylacetic acid degradation operon negative regulatory protein